MKRPTNKLRVPDSLAELPRGMHPHLKKKNKAPLALILSNPTELGRKTVILTGMEPHICVLQTALDLLQAGFSIHVPVDAVCSRGKEHWKMAIEQLKMAGGGHRLRGNGGPRAAAGGRHGGLQGPLQALSVI